MRNSLSVLLEPDTGKTYIGENRTKPCTQWTEYTIITKAMADVAGISGL